MAVVSVFIVSELMALVLFAVLHYQARARIISPGSATAWENTIAILASGAGFALVLGIVFGVWAIFSTHRICGPLYVVEGALRELARGRFPHRRPLRKKDEFKAFYDVFWDTVYAVKARSRRHYSAVGEALEITRTLKDADEVARLQGLKDLVMRLEAVRDELGQGLGEEAQESLFGSAPQGESQVRGTQSPVCAEVAG